ncbi:MAG: metal-dependent hydrolase [Euryarchaeota archaeon]|nr:metal-dependent hydrolase [Euryarchaeota archaeon]
MKQLTHAASGILLASLALHYTSHSTLCVLCVLCWTVTWSIISDFDVHIPTLEHRGPTHTLAFALLSGALVLALGKSPSTPFYASLTSLAILLHLVLDSLTPNGVPLWMPFSSKRVRFPVIGGKIRSDNRAFNLIIQAIAIGSAMMISTS